jgi:hypothetical protein
MNYARVPLGYLVSGAATDTWSMLENGCSIQPAGINTPLPKRKS